MFVRASQPTVPDNISRQDRSKFARLAQIATPSPSR
jgi:hypothetical protein